MTATRQRPRTCVACRTEAPKRALVRIARTPDGRTVLDAEIDLTVQRSAHLFQILVIAAHRGI